MEIAEKEQRAREVDQLELRNISDREKKQARERSDFATYLSIFSQTSNDVVSGTRHAKHDDHHAHVKDGLEGNWHRAQFSLGV